MKTQITLGQNKNNFVVMALFFICNLFSLNFYSQKIQTSLTEIWNNGAWENASKTTYTYDSNTFLIHDLTQNWDTAWKDEQLTDYTNNPDGTVQQSVSQSWNTGTSIWENFLRVNYTYNSAQQQLTSISEIWFDTDWTFVTKNTQAYDPSNYLITSLLENWNFIGPWTNSYLTSYTNNPDGTANLILVQKWNVSMWDNLQRVLYTYNSNSKPTISITENWNVSVWENSSKDLYDYDANGYLIHNLSQKWVTGTWIDDSQSFITNDGQGNPLEILSQNWDNVANKWVNDSKITLSYTSLAVIENAFQKSIAIYPNPSHDKVTIATNNTNPNLKYLVTDPVGKQVLNGSLDAKETVIDINPLATGVYFIQIMGQNESQTIKMIKE